MIRLADYIIREIAARGTDTAFMLSGGMMMHLMDAAGRCPSLRYICNHHEQACAMAADGYARVSGKPGLCLATSGPAATNILTGLVGAYQDSTPIVFLTGQVKLRDTVRASGIPGLRQLGFLEVDILPMVQSVTKYAAFIDDPKMVRYHVERALHECLSGRPGPVLLDVPLDLQSAMIDPVSLRGYEPPPPPAAVADAGDVIDRLRRAERPLILAGQGIRVAGSGRWLRELAEASGIPVAVTQMAKDLLPHDHPQYVGHPGVRGDRAGNFAVQTADVIVAIGSSLHNQTTGWEPELFAPQAHRIHVDPDAAVLRKSQAICSQQIRSEVVPFLRALDDGRWEPGRYAGWAERCRGWKVRYASKRESHHLGPTTGPANLYEVMDVVSDLLQGSEWIFTDAGQPTYVCPQGLRLRDGNRFFVNGSLAGMGWALPAAIGAAQTDPGRPILIIVGDGSLHTNVHELQTLRHTGANVKVIVINNDGYASIRATQARFFDNFFVGSSPESGVTLPPWEKMAAAYGLPYVSAPTRADLRTAIAAAMATDGPVLCEIVAQRDQDVRPGVPSAKQADGTLRSVPLHLMAPPLPDDVLAAELAFLGEQS